MKTFYKILFEILGWNIKGEMPKGIKKSLIVAAPHTIGKDFLYGILAFRILGLKGLFLIKESFFRWPLGYFLRKMGGIPVRKGDKGVIESAINYFNEHEECSIVIAPEGTRKLQEKWRRGFSYIAQGANVPIVIVYVDYKKKEVGIVPKLFWASNDPNKDLEDLQEIYRKLNVTAKYPEKYSLSPMYDED